jgi:precorrin-3B synthase
MNAIVPNKGWCPSLFVPMASGDGLLVRLRPPGAALPAAAARTLAAQAARCGNGVMELTQRAALQIRGLRPDTLAPFAAAMVQAGLADQDPSVERRRVVIGPPLGAIDPTASRHAAAVADAVEAILSRDPGLADLPPKFCVAVDGGGLLPLGDTGADISVFCDDDVCLVAPAGTAKAVVCAPGDAAAVTAALAAAFVHLSRGPDAPRRMRQITGADALFAQAGLVATPMQETANARTALGRIGTGPQGAFGLGLPFGACDTTRLAGLASLAEQFGDGVLRLTPWRALVIAGVAEPRVAGLAEAAETLGLIVTQDDPRSRMTACPGQPACASATVRTRADAAHLATLGLRGTIHLSGCAKGCAHRGAAHVTLVGQAGRYGLVRNGRAGDTPSVSGLTLTDIAALLRQDEA